MRDASLAREISAITHREPRVLRRSEREIASAIRNERCALRFDGADIMGFLFWHRYGARWAEVGTGYVAPAYRGKGVFTQMHDDVLRQIDARGLRAFGFPGNAAVEHVMQKLGFERASYAALPAHVWARFLVDHYTPRKLASNVRAFVDGAGRTSLHLYIRDKSA